MTLRYMSVQLSFSLEAAFFATFEIVIGVSADRGKALYFGEHLLAV